MPELRRWCFIAGFCENLSSVSKEGVFANAVPNRVVEFTYASTIALVRARVWSRHNELLSAAVLEKASLLRHHKLLRARIRHVVRDKRRGGALRKTGGGLPEQHHLLCYILKLRVKGRRCRAIGEYLGGRQRTILRTLGPWCTRRVRSHGSWPGGTIAHRRKMARRCSCCARRPLP